MPTQILSRTAMRSALPFPSLNPVDGPASSSINSDHTHTFQSAARASRTARRLLPESHPAASRHQPHPAVLGIQNTSSWTSTSLWSDQERWEGILRQWDVVADLKQHSITLTSKRAGVEEEIKLARQALEDRRTEVIDALSREFAETVARIGIPGVNSAAIDPKKYLPVINGGVFSKNNQLAGGITTATQIAYWCSLIAVALRTPDSPYPMFLLIDSPRMALNTAANVSKAMYARLTTLVGTLPGRLQVIIADNELPDDYRASYEQINISYAKPTVYTIDHPGPNAVKPIGTDASQDKTDQNP
ncbi:hypothetical protein [Lentzea sp. E54]|uniref:hypothetical protein n=1 Tax=Lentzea xerophila TaxID=3435883 RepID=UPI003DA1EBA3